MYNASRSRSSGFVDELILYVFVDIFLLTKKKKKNRHDS